LEFSSISDKPEKLLLAIDDAMAHIKQKYLKKGMNKTIRAMVIGIPNVGKSALLNRLAGQKKLKEGNRPGVTRGLQWVKLSPYLELMDTPGVLAPKLNDTQTAIKIAVLGSVKEEILNIEELALHFIENLKAIKPEALSKRYGIELQGTPVNILESICKKRGFLAGKGEYDLERGARTLLDEFQTGKLGRITLEKP
jgi:ribosome biogenesis GTPase A